MDHVIIDGGLDLVRARPATLPGRIRECLNYEVGWRRGMTRIDGWERFDGQTSPSSTTGWVIEVAKDEVTGTFVAPETLTWTIADETGQSGTLVAIEEAITEGGDVWRLFVVFRAARQRPVWGTTISGDTSGAYFLLSDPTTDVTNFTDYYPTHSEYISSLDSHAGVLRSAVNPVPGGGTIVGLHFHEDQLYAVRDMVEITVAGGEEAVLLPGMYVYNDAGEVGLVSSIDASARKVNITAVDQNGFSLVPSDVIHIALTVRFNTGLGDFTFTDGVLGDTSVWTGLVGKINRRDGSFDSGNAVGIAGFTGSDDVPTLGETFDNTTNTGSMVIEAVLFAPEASATVAATVADQSELATFWRSTDTGWEPADAGRVLQFTEGTVDPTDTENPTDFSLSVLPNEVKMGTGLTNPWVGDINNIKLTNAAVITNTLSGGTPVEGFVDQSVFLEVWDFRAGLLDNDIITGIQFEFESLSSVASFDWEAKALGAAGGAPSHVATCPVSVTLEPIQCPPAPNALWGIDLIPAEINALTFGAHFVAKAYLPNTAPELDSVSLVITGTRLPGSKLYLYDPAESANVGYISVSGAVVDSGAWAEAPYNDPDTDLAIGHFRLRDWSVSAIPAGTEIWTAVDGAGIFIANVEGGVTTPALAGSKLLDEERSRYQMISYNFFASESSNAIYGCSGAGPAFWYDGTTLDFIQTGVDSTLEKPRHVAQHQSRLCLGYKWGEVYVSDANGPTTFNGQVFAASYGFGDKITGLMPVSGEALGVFTESSIHVLIGNNGGEVSPRQQVVNHKVGAIEYTVQNMGNRPIFASFRGIETLETMDQYSDFFTAPLTYDVTPWLLERLQTAAGLEATDKSVVNSIVIRNKNQYRLFFADGAVLTLTYVGPEKDAQCTTQAYWFNSDQDQYARCYATASGVTPDGRDRAFFSAEKRPPLPFDYAPSVGEELSYVYELDKGRSFDGGTIDAHFDLTHYFARDEQGGPNVGAAKKYSVFHLHGTCPGTASLRISRSVNYEYMDSPELPYELLVWGADSMSPEDLHKPKYGKGRLTARGYAVSMRITHSSAIEFPHTIQLLTFLNTEELKQDL